MKTTVLTVGSVTYAIKAKRLLSREGISAKLIKSNAENTAEGCAYGIKFPTKDFYGAVSVLRSAGIYYQIYEKQADIF